jgi:hypothetical protein
MLTVEGNLMIAIQARSFNHYFYLQSNNTNHPARFVHNKVTGILFEGKVDYTSMYLPSHLPSPLSQTPSHKPYANTPQHTSAQPPSLSTASTWYPSTPSPC